MPLRPQAERTALSPPQARRPPPGEGRIRKVDQQHILETDLLKGGRQQLQERYRDAFRVLGGLLSIAFVGAFVGVAVAAAFSRAAEDAQRPRQGARPDTGLWPGFGARVGFELTLARWPTLGRFPAGNRHSLRNRQPAPLIRSVDPCINSCPKDGTTARRH